MNDQPAHGQPAAPDQAAPDQAAAAPAAARTLGRRGFLARAGAAGLTAAATMFGTSQPAQAQSAMCCGLIYGIDSRCWNNVEYVWSCTVTVSLWCRCCEDYSNERSAYTCRYN